MWEHVIHRNTKALHLHGNTEQGGMQCDQVLEHGDEKHEDTCDAAITVRVVHTSRGRGVLGLFSPFPGW